MKTGSLSYFYTSREWAAFRDITISQRTNSNGEIICEHCGKPIIKKYDIIAHHKKELNDINVNDALIALNPDNIQLVHHVCHNKIHNKLGLKKQNVFVVYGAPLSGKTSYVAGIAEVGDLIIDIDNIWQCVSGQPRYIKPLRLNEVVFNIRDQLLECVKYRRGKWDNCYIIGGYPLCSERERLCKELGAKPIYIETSKEICINRLDMCNDKRNKTDWNKYINNWFENFS